MACESTVKSEIEEGIAAVMKDVVEGLTRPLTPEEKSPKPQTGKTPRVAFKGSLQDVNRFYYSKGWTDGLPIIPPTEAAVAEMMTGTDLPPDHIVATIIPRKGKATIEKIAINAVMAGALPTYMPVLIAAVQSFADPKTRFDTFEVSTGSWAPFFAINGRIRNDINVNCSSGALSPGNIANAAIGRAVGLIVKNIGGARKAIEDMGVIGNPGKYSLVIGEDEEASPWEPLSVERGFKKEDNTVTVFFPNTFHSDGPSRDKCTRDSGYACRHDDQHHVQRHSYSFMGQGFVERRMDEAESQRISGGACHPQQVKRRWSSGRHKSPES